MLNFKYVNKEKLKRIGSAILITAMIGSTSVALTSCGSDDKIVVVEDDRKNYGIFIENDIATIYTVTRYYDGYGTTTYNSSINAEQTVILDGSLLHF